MTKTIGVVSVIAVMEPGSGTLERVDAKLLATNRLNAVYSRLQEETKNLGMSCRLVNLTYVEQGNFYARNELYSVIEAVGVFESELYSTQAELDAIRKELGFQNLGQHIREGIK